MIEINNRLKKLRKDRKLTQQQLAEGFGLGISSISSYESGDRKPSYAVLKQYSAYFHVSTDYILGFENRQMLDISDLTEDEKDSIRILMTKYREKRK